MSGLSSSAIIETTATAVQCAYMHHAEMLALKKKKKFYCILYSMYNRVYAVKILIAKVAHC